MAQEVRKESGSVVETPSGLSIRYQEQPERFYEVSRGDEWIRCDVSASGVADVLAKDGLSWWGQMIGLDAIIWLWNVGQLRPYPKLTESGQIDGWVLQAFVPQYGWQPATADNLKALLTMNKITVNHQRDKAGDRGTSVHKALEHWIDEGVLPVPANYPIEERGYVEGLLKFLNDLGPLKSKPQSEVIVGSWTHRWAGRYDMEAVLQDARLCVKLATPAWTPPEQLAEGEKNHHSAKPPEYEEFKGRTLFDLKTSSGIYTSQQIQMALYEGGRIECGYPKTTQQIVVRVTSDGNYVVKKVLAKYSDALLVLSVARLMARLEAGEETPDEES